MIAQILNRIAGLLRARRERPRGSTAEQCDELASLHCLMLPVFPTERIAHLGTVDCCIHPPGRYETIAVTPPIISSKEVAQNRPPHFPRQNLPQHQKSFSAKFPGMGPG
jgi:hypothetical protein